MFSATSSVGAVTTVISAVTSARSAALAATTVVRSPPGQFVRSSWSAGEVTVGIGLGVPGVQPAVVAANVASAPSRSSV